MHLKAVREWQAVNIFIGLPSGGMKENYSAGISKDSTLSAHSCAHCLVAQR